MRVSPVGWGLAPAYGTAGVPPRWRTRRPAVPISEYLLMELRTRRWSFLRLSVCRDAMTGFASRIRLSCQPSSDFLKAARTPANEVLLSAMRSGSPPPAVGGCQ